MRISITSIEASIIDVSTNEEDKFIIAFWKIKYSARLLNPKTPFSPMTILEGELTWKEEQVNIEEVLHYIKGLFND